MNPDDPCTLTASTAKAYSMLGSVVTTWRYTKSIYWIVTEIQIFTLPTRRCEINIVLHFGKELNWWQDQTGLKIVERDETHIGNGCFTDLECFKQQIQVRNWQTGFSWTTTWLRSCFCNTKMQCNKRTKPECSMSGLEFSNAILHNEMAQDWTCCDLSFLHSKSLF